MAVLVNQTLKGVFQGVSQQTPELRFEAQVDEMENCIPSVSRGLLRRNPTANVKNLPSLTNTDFFVYSYDRGTTDEQYIILVGNNEYYIYNTATDTEVAHVPDVFAATGSTYLQIGAVSPKDAFSAVTIADVTFIVNNTKTVALEATVDGTADSHKTTGVYWIKRTTLFNTGTSVIGHTYTLNGYTSPNTVGGDSTAVATNIATGLGSPPYQASGSIVYQTGMLTTAAWTWSDSFGNLASQGFKGEIRASNLLPAELPAALNNTLVNITGESGEEFDDYWLKWNGVSWAEDRKPGMQNTLDATTMPHVLTRTGPGVFTFGTYADWEPRKVGSEETIPNPSFVDKTISNIFFYKNRLGVLADDSVVLSGLGDYGNFWGTSAKTVPADDPIDLTVATLDVSLLSYAVPTADTLLLFSNNTQFTLSSDGPLTPTTAYIGVASNYNFTKKAPPQAIGNIVYFTSESGESTQLFGYRLTEGQEITSGENLTIHVPSYIPKNVRQIAGHSVFGYTFFLSTESAQTLYVYNTLEKSKRIVQSAFHKWTFAEDIIGITVLDDFLYLVMKDISNNITFQKLTLEVPTSHTSVTYQDNGGTNYVSRVVLTRWSIKDADDIGTTRGRLQIRTIKFSVDTDSKFLVRLTNSVVLDLTAGFVVENGFWNDSGTWLDSGIWNDTPNPVYQRDYTNDDKITIMGNSRTTAIEFRSNPDTPTEGFGVNTINMEGLFHQRSQRI